MSRFKEMYHTMRESCLFDTHAWGKIKERIQLSQSGDVHILPSPISFPILPDIYLQEIRIEDAAAIYLSLIHILVDAAYHHVQILRFERFV